MPLFTNKFGAAQYTLRPKLHTQTVLSLEHIHIYA